MSAINSGLAAITSVFNVVTVSASAVETLARTGCIWAGVAEEHAKFNAAKQQKKNEMRLTLLDQRVQREVAKEDSFL